VRDHPDLDFGAVIAEGTPGEIQNNPRSSMPIWARRGRTDAVDGGGPAGSYDNIKALHGVSFRIDEGEIVCIIGANGAGKSTTLRAISASSRSKRGRR